MNDEPKQIESAGGATTPLWLIVLFSVLFYGGLLYLDQASGGFEPQVGKCLIVLPAHLAVDFQEAREQVARALRIDLVHDSIEKRVVDLQIARAEFLQE